MTSIYLHNHGGEVRGPFTAATIKYWLEQGACAPEDLAWTDDHKEWRPLGRFDLDPTESYPWHRKVTNNLPFASLAIGLVMGFLNADSSHGGVIILITVFARAFRCLAAQVLFGRLLALPIAPIVMAFGKLRFKTAFGNTFAVFSIAIVVGQTLALGLNLSTALLGK